MSHCPDCKTQFLADEQNDGCPNCGWGVSESVSCPLCNCTVNQYGRACYQCCRKVCEGCWSECGPDTSDVICDGCKAKEAAKDAPKVYSLADEVFEFSAIAARTQVLATTYLTHQR